MKFLLLPLLILLVASLTGCTSPYEGSDPIEDFVEITNSVYGDKNPQIHAYGADRCLLIEMNLETTPENYGKLRLLTSSRDAQKKMHDILFKSIKQRPAVVQLIKEKKSIIYCIAAGNLKYYVEFPYTELAKACKQHK